MPFIYIQEHVHSRVVPTLLDAIGSAVFSSPIGIISTVAQDSNGAVYFSAYNTGSSAYSFKSTYCRVNADGTLVWLKRFDNDTQIKKILIASDDSVYVVGHGYTVPNSSVYIAKINVDTGVPVWQKLYVVTTSGASIAPDPVSAPQSWHSFNLAGAVIDNNNQIALCINESRMTGSDRLHFAKFDLSGNMVANNAYWNTIGPSATVFRAWSFDYNPSNGMFYAMGETTPSNNFLPCSMIIALSSSFAVNGHYVTGNLTGTQPTSTNNPLSKVYFDSAGNLYAQGTVYNSTTKYLQKFSSVLQSQWIYTWSGTTRSPITDSNNYLYNTSNDSYTEIGLSASSFSISYWNSYREYYQDYSKDSDYEIIPYGSAGIQRRHRIYTSYDYTPDSLTLTSATVPITAETPNSRIASCTTTVSNYSLSLTVNLTPVS